MRARIAAVLLGLSWGSVGVLAPAIDGAAAPAPAVDGVASPAPKSTSPAATAPARKTLASAEGLRARLRRGGRASASFSHRLTDEQGVSAPRSGRVALEPPDRVRLDFHDDGECLTLRGDGGEWLQPSVRQLVLLPADQVGAAARLWDLFLDGRPEGISERLVRKRTYLLTAESAEPAAFDSVWVTLDPSRLPARIEASLNGQRVSFALSGWSFGTARGVSAFTQVAPTGVATVPLR